MPKLHDQTPLCRAEPRTLELDDRDAHGVAKIGFGKLERLALRIPEASDPRARYVQFSLGTCPVFVGRDESL